jgi:hypothetical protein
MAFMNQTDYIGQITIMMTENITGHPFFTFLLVFLFFILLALMFKLPLELTIAINLPLAFVLAIGVGGFMPILSLLALYTAIILAKKFIAI